MTQICAAVPWTDDHATPGADASRALAFLWAYGNDVERVTLSENVAKALAERGIDLSLGFIPREARRQIIVREGQFTDVCFRDASGTVIAVLLV